MSKKATFEIQKLDTLARAPDGLRLLEEYKNNMRFCRSWNGLYGTDCFLVSEYLEQLIAGKKKPVSVSDML